MPERSPDRRLFRCSTRTGRPTQAAVIPGRAPDPHFCSSAPYTRVGDPRFSVLKRWVKTGWPDIKIIKAVLVTLVNTERA
jgi:hypothetical protein